MSRARTLRLTDPGYEQLLGRILTEHLATALPTDHQLDQAAQVTPADIDQALALWDESQRAARTGLAGRL
jgi:hypothetical protein